MYSATRLLKIGYVDLDLVLNSYPGYKDIKLRLFNEKLSIDKELEKIQDELKSLENDYNNIKNNISEDEKLRRQSEINYKKEQLLIIKDNYESNLESLKEELLNPIISNISIYIQKIGKEKGYSYIFKKTGDILLYYDKEFDITKDVISRLESELFLSE